MVNKNYKKYIYSGIFLVVLGVATFFASINMYSGMVENEYDNSKEMQEVEETSRSQSKTINEVVNEAQVATAENEVIENTEEIPNKEIQEIQNQENKKVSVNVVKKEETKPQEEQKKELEFIMPLEGEISKNFSNENLIYSDTLEEWILHLGLDILGEIGTEVKASEEGKILSIKKDPRYGLTLVVEHQDGYKTLYANLDNVPDLNEGENVTKGQIIGYIGNSASFESMDACHLHFEALKGDVKINPLDLFKTEE